MTDRIRAEFELFAQKQGFTDLITIDRVEMITRAENMARNTIHARGEELRALSMLKRRLTRAVNKRIRHEEQASRPE